MITGRRAGGPAARAARAIAAFCAAGTLVAFAPRETAAQLSPHADWRTIRTEHFRVHFTPRLETVARRAATSAEIAYAGLASELVPPRGTVDIVISDDADFSNGSATPFPTNRIVVYAHPPTEGESLRFYHDWLALVITHELTHVFHLDRTRGWWRAVQWVVGRNPFLFPNQYSPRWVTEGLAVYYESRLTGFGRLAGTEHRTIARAHALEALTPRLDEISLGTPRFPGGQSAYVFGSLLFDHLAETSDPRSVPAFVERSSSAPLPFMLDRVARRSFGVSFTDAWRVWRDSLELLASGDAPAGADAPMPGWRELTREGRHAYHPRWLDDSTLVYSASTGREIPGAYRVGLDGRPRRIGPRNALDPSAPFGDGALVFSQPEFRSPFTVRSDLWIQRGRRVERLTSGARLLAPHARDDGGIVAVRAGQGTTHLVRVTEGGEVASLTRAHADTLWSAPAWSPRGDRIAAVRWIHGGTNEIVVLDTLGTVTHVLARTLAVSSAPAWTPDGEYVLYSTDLGGATDVNIAPATVTLGDGSSTPSLVPGTRRISDSRTALLQPAVSPNGELIAAVHFRADGYHIGVAPLEIPPAARAEPGTLGAGSSFAGAVGIAASLVDGSGGGGVNGGGGGGGGDGGGTRAREPAPAEQQGPATKYSPWRSLVPRYWLPTIIDVTRERAMLGALTSGRDLVGRHNYTAQVMGTTDGEQHLAELFWRYAGLGQPAIDVGVVHREEAPLVFEDGSLMQTELRLLGTLGFTRLRYRSFAFANVGGELERFELRTDPAPLRDSLGILPTVHRRAVFLGFGWSNATRPALAISPENGIALSGYAEQRWSSELARSATRLIGTANAYRALNLPGFSHHVIALRGAAAWTGEESFSRFSIGGTSGSTVGLAPGVQLGDTRRTFGVRGFPVQTRRGTRALGATAEYRAPLWMPARGYRLLPLFFDRSSLTLFAEGATTWCPPAPRAGLACPVEGFAREWIASAGAELNLDAAVLSYDFPYRFRMGVAAPWMGREHADARLTLYVTMGASF